jgi:hypothetical protein
MKRKMWGVLEDDVWSEVGKAIAFSIPTSFLLTIFYHKYPSILLMLSTTVDAATIMDVFAHSFAAAGVCGFLYVFIRNNFPRNRHVIGNVRWIAVVLALVIMIPGWEGFEQLTGKSVVIINEDWPKDIVSDFVGVFSYVGIESLRNRLKAR